jgi:hypothetical protein
MLLCECMFFICKHFIVQLMFLISVPVFGSLCLADMTKTQKFSYLPG